MNNLISKPTNLQTFAFHGYDIDFDFGGETRMINATKMAKAFVSDLEAHQTTRDTNYYTIAGFAYLLGKSVDRNEAALYGRVAAKMSREKGYKIGKVYDSRYGQVNEYHKDILQYIVSVDIS